MAAASRKPELKDFRTEGDSEGSVIDFQKRNMDYQKALREWEGQQKGPANSNKPAVGSAAPAPAAPGAASSPKPALAPSTPGAISAAPPAASSPTAGGVAPQGGAGTGGFSLKTNVKRDSANESKGEFGSAQFEAKYNKIANQIVGLYNQQMPMLRNYDQMVQTQIDTLIGETMPQVQEMFRQSGEQYGYAKDFYESAKGYDTADRREATRGRAMTDVRMAGEASRDQALESLESYGIDPSQARGAALDQNLRLQTALAEAQAGTQAELGVEQRGRDYTAQGLGVLGEAANRTAANTAAGANILEGNAKAQMAAKQGAIQTGEAGQRLLEGASGQIQSSQAAKQAKAASIAARQAAKGDQKGAAIAGISNLVGMTAASALGGPAAGALASYLLPTATSAITGTPGVGGAGTVASPSGAGTVYK
jgi:hypothetical protein